jgi:hypothetical protein
MLVDLQELVCGHSIKTVHDFLKRHFGYEREVEFVDRELAPQYFGKGAGDLVNELISRGWLERKTQGKRKVYDLTKEGNRFAITKMTPRFPRAKGEEIIAAMIERAKTINSRRDLCCSIGSLRLFGSMLDPQVSLVGDVDVAYELVRRVHPDGTDWIEWNIERFKASGRKSGSYLDMICFGDTEVVRLLKGGVRGLSLHSQHDLDGITKKSGVKSRAIFSETQP